MGKFDTYDVVECSGRYMSDYFKSPVEFTSHEGGKWKKWEYGELPEGWEFIKEESNKVIFNAVAVHSFKFKENDKTFEWDCINSWRKIHEAT